MKPFISVAIKPSMSCNIDCRHCYHLPEERIEGTMSHDVLDRLFRLVSEEYDSVWFIWHGGEPLTLPLKFYRDAMDLQEKHFGKDTHRVSNTIQTNGTLLDRRFIGFCRDNRINLGVSYEGPYNDCLRQKTADVERNLSALSDKERVFSVSSTISSDTVSKQPELYRYFRDRRMSVSFSPVIPSGCADLDRSLVPDAGEYIGSSIKAFDEWLLDADTEIPLIPHYLYLLNSLGEPTESDCAHTSCLTKWVCVYPNGDVYPCAKGCPKEFRMCNISETEHISDVFRTEGFRRILSGSIARRAKCASGCDLYGYCNGGCSMDAFYECGLENSNGDSCRIFKAVFGHVHETAESILRDKPDLSVYNRFVRDAILAKLVNPKRTE